MHINRSTRGVDLKAGNVLWIAGPAKISVVNGLVEVFGAKIKAGESIIVKRYKSIYVKALNDSNLSVSAEAYFKNVESDGIPDDWRKLISNIMCFKGKIMVLGGMDSGKNTLVTFLSNQLFDLGFKVGILDSDIGQNEIGPPTTMALGLVTRPLTSLAHVDLLECVFIGSTSPAYVHKRFFNGLAKLIAISDKLGLDYLLINTTGWISNGGVKFKVEKIKFVKPDFLIGIQRENELEPIFNLIGDEYKIFRIPPSQMVRARNRFERKMIRQMNYFKWFINAANKKVLISDLHSIEPKIFNNSQLNNQTLKRLSEFLGVNVFYSTMIGDKLLIYSYNPVDIDSSINDKIISELGVKGIIIIPFSDLIPLLVAFEDVNGKFAGLGIITNVDLNGGLLQIYTNVDLPWNKLKLILGLIKVNPSDFDEIGFSKIPL